MQSHDPHYMKPEMVDSQFAIYGAPSADEVDVLPIDDGKSFENVIEEFEAILRMVGLHGERLLHGNSFRVCIHEEFYRAWEGVSRAFNPILCVHIDSRRRMISEQSTSKTSANLPLTKLTATPAPSHDVHSVGMKIVMDILAKRALVAVRCWFHCHGPFLQSL